MHSPRRFCYAGSFQHRRTAQMKSLPVVERTIRGIANAQNEYRKWSGGDWLWAAPEYMATTSIARSVYALDSVAFVTMENNVRAAIDGAGGSLVGRPNQRLPLEGRFDLVVWNTREPRGVIEVKTGVVGVSTLSKDIDRLCTALDKADRIRWGLIAYFLSFGDGERKSAQARVKDRTAGIASKAKERVHGAGLHFMRHAGRVRSDGSGAWTAEVLEIRRAW